MSSLFNPELVETAGTWTEMIQASGLERQHCTVSPNVNQALMLVFESQRTLTDLECLLVPQFNQFELKMIMMALKYRLECMQRQAFAQEASCLREAALHEALLAVDPQAKKEGQAVQELLRELESVQSSMSHHKRLREGDQ